MILNLWMENTLHVKVFKNTSLSCIFPSFEAAHSTIKYVTVPVLAKKKKKNLTFWSYKIHRIES